MSNERSTIILVDDNVASLTIGKEILKKQYKVIPVPSAAKMFEALTKVLPALILLDVNMPDMNGFEAIEKLKSESRFRNIPVIFLTQKSDEANELKGLSLGAIDYVFKPYSGPLLLKRIENILAQKRSDEANRVKSSFIASMSHEIRTPMNAIVGMTELLRHKTLDEQQMGYVNDIGSSARTLISIIDSLFDISQFEANNMKLAPVNYDFGEFLESLASVHEKLAKKKNIDFRFEKIGDLPGYLYSDKKRLEQVLTDLLKNAISFTDSGYVRFSAKAVRADGKDMLRFEIEDTGKGIRSEDLPKLFDIYAESDTIKNRAVVGTGLRLSLCKSFIELMDGQISVASVFTQGTVFTITIPLEKGSAEEEKAPDIISAPSAHALVVDDNDINLSVMESILSEIFGMNVQTSLSGEESIELVKLNDYDIIFMDHMMPHMDGVEATQKIRGLGGKYLDIPIIALTATVGDGAEEMFLANGFSKYLRKPIDARLINDLLSEWLPADKVVY